MPMLLAQPHGLSGPYFGEMGKILKSGGLRSRYLLAMVFFFRIRTANNDLCVRSKIRILRSASNNGLWVRYRYYVDRCM